MLRPIMNVRKHQIQRSISRARAIAIILVTLSVIGLLKTAFAVTGQSSPIETQYGTEASHSTACVSEAPAYNASTGAIFVLVLDFNTSAPISGVAVFVWEKGVSGSGNYSESTDANGYANISYVLPGQYDLWIVPFSSVYMTEWAHANVTAQQIVNITVYLEHWPPSAYGGQAEQGGTSLASSGWILVAYIFVLILILGAASWRTGTRSSVQDFNRPGTTTPTRETEELRTAPANTCRYCGSDIVVPGSVFCWNCGASLEPSVQAVVTPVKINEKRLGRNCTVCQLELSSGDEIVYCPHCGNPAHRDHLLKWLHIRGICPACSQHLDERELRTKASKRKPPRHGTKSPK